MRISKTPPTTTGNYYTWGWGPDSTTSAIGSNLLLGPVLVRPTQVLANRFTYTVPTNGLRTCAGDSGGPATRAVAITALGTRHVIVGSSNSFVPRIALDCAGAGSVSTW